MKIMKTKSADEFHTLLEALIGELTQAQDHFGLATDLTDAASGEYARVFAQSPAFWYLTHRAHIDAAFAPAV